MWEVLEIRPRKRPKRHGPYVSKTAAMVKKIRLMTKHQNDDHEFYVVQQGRVNAQRKLQGSEGMLRSHSVRRPEEV